MADKQKREPVHYGLLYRRLMECLPDVKEGENFIAPTITALAAYADTFFYKEDLEAGVIRFTGTASYSQLAKFMKVGVSTAKWRCNQLTERFGILTWQRSKVCIKFSVSYRGQSVNRLAHSVEEAEEEESANPLAISQPVSQSSQLTGGVESANGKSSQLIGGSESANPLATLSSVFKSTVERPTVVGRHKSFKTSGETPETPEDKNQTQIQDQDQDLTLPAMSESTIKNLLAGLTETDRQQLLEDL